jgi:hypothetical protein
MPKWSYRPKFLHYYREAICITSATVGYACAWGNLMQSLIGVMGFIGGSKFRPNCLLSALAHQRIG